MNTKEKRRAAVSFSERGFFKKAIFVGTWVLFCGAFSAAHAQQTIFNVPSTDVLDRGKVYGELDVSFKPTDSTSVNKFSSFVPRVVVGAGSRIEIGLNITGNLEPGPDTTTLVPAFKWKPYQGKSNGVAIAACWSLIWTWTEQCL
ncbi:MAG: hypothetical protein M3R69_13245 [Acidobacteriota bacterium]|nr:hypothetical protein [Acidobacteriota bacterium]